jgi:hypothetical protein
MKENKMESRREGVITFFGWVGILCIIFAYTLNTLEIISIKDMSYHLINFFGAAFITIKVYHAKIWSNVFLEAFWALVAVYGILKVLGVF